MKITPQHRKKLYAYLKGFYKYYPQERHTIFHFVKYLKQRLKFEKDAWIGVSGDTGSGKSLYVLSSMILFGRPMSLTKNVAYIPKGQEIVNALNKLKFQCYLIDEAAREMRSVNWQSKQQQAVNMTAMTERYKNNAVFLNMPNFAEFTKSMKAGNIMFRAIIPYRNEKFARVIIQRKSRNWRSPDPWGDDAANNIYNKLDKGRKEITNEVILNVERSMPNTIMDFIIPNLAIPLPDVVEEYERLKIESRKTENLLEPEEKLNRYKSKYQDLLNKMSKVLMNNELNIGKVKVTKSEIAKVLGITPQTLTKYVSMPLPGKGKPTFRDSADK